MTAIPRTRSRYYFDAGFIVALSTHGVLELIEEGVMPRSGIAGLRLPFAVGGCLILTALLGCGSGVPMGKVTGKVTYNAQPVKDGDLTFVPVPGPADKDTPRQPGVAVIENGSFTTTTTKPGDGLGVGKYSVSFNPRSPSFEAPEYDGVGAPPEAPKSEYIGLVPKETQVEIKAGSNDLNIELVAGPTPQQ